MNKRFRTNSIALVLALIILTLGNYCRADAEMYYEAMRQREEFAEVVADAIKSGEPIDQEEIQEVENSINQDFQDLANNTDLGRVIAKNDKSKEGRKDNSLIFASFFVLMISCCGVVIINVIRLIVDIIWTIPKMIRDAIRNAREAKRNSDDDEYYDSDEDQEFE